MKKGQKKLPAPNDDIIDNDDSGITSAKRGLTFPSGRVIESDQCLRSPASLDESIEGIKIELSIFRMTLPCRYKTESRDPRWRTTRGRKQLWKRECYGCDFLQESIREQCSEAYDDWLINVELTPIFDTIWQFSAQLVDSIEDIIGNVEDPASAAGLPAANALHECMVLSAIDLSVRHLEMSTSGKRQ